MSVSPERDVSWRAARDTWPKVCTRAHTGVQTRARQTSRRCPARKVLQGMLFFQTYLLSIFFFRSHSDTARQFPCLSRGWWWPQCPERSAVTEARARKQRKTTLSQIYMSNDFMWKGARHLDKYLGLLYGFGLLAEDCRWIFYDLLWSANLTYRRAHALLLMGLSWNKLSICCKYIYDWMNFIAECVSRW